MRIPFFYFFNSLIVFLIFALHSRSGDATVRALLVGTVASLVLLFALAVYFGPATLTQTERTARSILFFNNPNQLGYWGLLSISIFAVLSNRLRIGIVRQFPLFAISFYLIAISLGKAASISFFILLVIHFARRPSHFLLTILVAAVGFVMVQDSEFIANLSHRLGSIGSQADDDVLGRGYGRLVEHSQYLLLGGGEYGLSRYPGETAEIHSTFATILYSYGFIGALLFASIIWRIYRAAGLANLMYLMPAFVYGITHQGLRFSLLWALFAVIAVIGHQRQPENSVRDSTSRPPSQDHGNSREAGINQTSPTTPNEIAPGSS